MPRISEGTRGKVGPLSPGQWRDAARSLNESKAKNAGQQTNATESFLARIKSDPKQISTFRWRYQWEEIVIKDDHSIEAKPAPRQNRPDSAALGQFTWALNMCEMCQVGGSPTTVGPGINIASIPPGFEPKPIAANTCVIMNAFLRKSGKVVYCFSMPNAIDGTCTSSLGGGSGGSGGTGQTDGGTP